MFLELLGYEIDRNSYKKKIWDAFLDKYDFKSQILNNFQVLIKKKEVFSFLNGYIIKFDFKKYKKDYSFNNIFSLIIHKDLNYLFLETEGSSSFKSQIINIFNKSFKNQINFYSLNFFTDQGWAFLNKYKDITFLQIITDKNGIIEIEDDFEGKEDYPIYSSILKVQIDDKTYSIQFNKNGFNFPPRMKDFEILSFLEQTKQILL